MRLILHFAWKDSRRLARDPLGLALWLGMPLLVVLVMLALFGRSAPRPHGILFIADLDGTFLSSLASRVYTQGELGEMITVRRTSLEEGRRRMQAGDGSALLILPKGFSEAVLRGQPATLELITNPSQTILPDMLKEMTEVLADGAWYLQQMAGSDLRRFSELDSRPPDSMVANFSIRISRWIDQYLRYLDPPAIEVNSTVVSQDPAGGQSLTSLMFPSMMFMAILFLAFGYSGDIWEEKMHGTLRRTATTAAAIPQFLAGKLLLLGALYAAIALLAAVIGRLALGYQAQNLGLAMLWCVLSGWLLYLILLLLHTLAGGTHAAHVLVNLVVVSLAMLGGCFFPFELMPAFLARLGRLTPNGWLLVRLRDLLGGTAGPGMVAAEFAAVAVATGLLFYTASRRLRGSFLI